jgi:hypothetical protein
MNWSKRDASDKVLEMTLNLLERTESGEPVVPGVLRSRLIQVYRDKANAERKCAWLKRERDSARAYAKSKLKEADTWRARYSALALKESREGGTNRVS